MEVFRSILIYVVVLLISGCSGDHLISNRDYLDHVNGAFRERQVLADGNALFSSAGYRIGIGEQILDNIQ